MYKKWLLVLVLTVFVIVGISAQQIVKKTITELGPLGGALRTITVNAVYMTSGQQSLSLEGEFEVIRETTLDPSTGQWSPWEVKQKSPARFANIRTYYEHFQMDNTAYPNGTRILHIDDLQVFRLPAIPRGHSSPIWWSEDGKSVYLFFEWYRIVP